MAKNSPAESARANAPLGEPGSRNNPGWASFPTDNERSSKQSASCGARSVSVQLVEVDFVLHSNQARMLNFLRESPCQPILCGRRLWRTLHEMIILYGIPNCDGVKKARAWFTTRGVAHDFHDFKKSGVPVDALATWVQALGRDKLVNRQGTTWRKLDAATQASVVDDASAMALLQAHPSLIKRPVVGWTSGFTVGFDADAWARRLTAA